MPTQTFFRLPEEKRTRLTQAAWQEFSSVRFSEASINRIVHAAQIPRGSFYQYFADKDDLFFFLLDTLYEDCLTLASEALERAEGNLFDAVVIVFDLLFTGKTQQELAQGMELLRRNDTMDMSQVLFDRSRHCAKLEELLCRADIDMLRRNDAAFFRDVATLLISNLMLAMREMLCGGSYEAERATLCTRVDIVQRGSTKEEYR
ncbi:MAG: TetR/AcrR family transcriptional regulator [Oscillospiraceae bacterium]|nr:TetR/AcrR family transcriptional regulator [Oscillospiraceae bacterium]